MLAVTFAALTTFYWELWEIPWLAQEASANVAATSKNSTSLETSTSDQGSSNSTLIPIRPTCVQADTLDPPTNYCVWSESNNDCLDLMSRNLQGSPTWVFLGDSEMVHIVSYLSQNEVWPFGGAPSIKTRRNPCHNLLYYGLPPPEAGWQNPNATNGEGPIGLGLKTPFCMDCKNCWNLRMAGTLERYVEYLVVEYARDVSIPSLVTKTTQETAVYYLNQAPPAVCIASAGLLDASIDPTISVEVYKGNADKYVGLLQRTCQQVVWITIHPVVESDVVPQTNCQLREWNTAFVNLLKERNYDNVWVVDIWDASFEAHYNSETKLMEQFFATLAEMFKTLMDSR
eukprot:Nitzschia sp. Nitz4//scaffold3_size479765//93791//94819//NITZ4_000036-RA/size479765-processed-gene-0.56-mRNA-1//1//CDS//3329550566//1851//frame0